MIESAGEFVRLRSSSDREEYLRAATEEAAVDVWLDVMRLYPVYKRWVAHNKKVPLMVLELLASDADPEVRHMVAMKNCASEPILASLAKDEDSSVRQRVAHNKNTPSHLLQQLTADPSELVADAARDRLSRRACA